MVVACIGSMPDVTQATENRVGLPPTSAGLGSSMYDWRSGYDPLPSSAQGVRQTRPSVQQAVAGKFHSQPWIVAGSLRAEPFAAASQMREEGLFRPPGDPEPFARLRRLYYAAVEEESAIEEAVAEIEWIGSELRPVPGSPTEALLHAYAGAVVTLRAKHGFWPPSRLRHLREGLATLDAAVQAHPEIAEIRYLRLMSCYYLPGILGRGSSVREDFAALAHLLPKVRNDYPPELYGAIVSFVLENGSISEDERTRLEAALQGSPL